MGTMTFGNSQAIYMYVAAYIQMTFKCQRNVCATFAVFQRIDKSIWCFDCAADCLSVVALSLGLVFGLGVSLFAQSATPAGCCCCCCLMAVVCCLMSVVVVDLYLPKAKNTR